MNASVDVHLDEEEIHMLSNLLYEEWEKCYEEMRWAGDAHAREHAAEHVDEARTLYEKIVGIKLPDAPLGEEAQDAA